MVREKRNKLCGLLGLQRPVVRVSIQTLLQYIFIQAIHMQASGSRAAKPTLAASDTMASYRGIYNNASLYSDHGGMIILFRSGGQSWLLMSVRKDYGPMNSTIPVLFTASYIKQF